MDKLEQIEQHLKSGRLGLAIEGIKTVSQHRLKRTDRLKLANLARRVGQPGLALRLLNNFVRETKDASSLEICEYAIALIRAGYYSEGKELLNSIDTQKFGEALLYVAFANVYQWNYEQAQIHLENYLKLDLTEYERLVAEVNLAASMIMTHQPKGKTISLLSRILVSTENQKAVRLRANALELKAQALVLSDDHVQALKCLKEAESIVDMNVDYDGLFIKKWRALLELKKKPSSAQARNQVLAVRNVAYKVGHWETARDCDLYLGLWHRNRSVLTHLYFGTPYEAYKKRILNQAEKNFTLPSSYLWRLSSKGKPNLYFDLDSGCDQNGKVVLDSRRQSVRLLTALCSDFYRPMRIADLAVRLFPGEYFNPHSTNDRVHQALRRLRLDLQEVRLPLTVEESKGFRLRANSDFGILTHTQAISQDLDLRIQKAFGESPFNISQVEDLLGWPRRTLQAKLAEKVEAGEVKKTGKGPSTQYLLVKKVSGPAF